MAMTPLLETALEAHRAELRHHCRRMLGSAFDADDAVQETLVRAWLFHDRFEGRSSLRSWLYSIAGNVCMDLLRSRGRRPVPTADLTPLAAPDDPADLAVTRDAVRTALGVAAHLLPPRQRAVLILREVLRWRAKEVADLLGTSVASVNSALQRARTTLASHDPEGFDVVHLGSAPHRRLADGYVTALATDDVDSIVTLLREHVAAA